MKYYVFCFIKSFFCSFDVVILLEIAVMPGRELGILVLFQRKVKGVGYATSVLT